MVCRINQKALFEYSLKARNGRVVVFDTETTGISCNDEIVQIAAAEYVDGSLKRTFNAYVIPTCPINPAAEAVHHLSLSFLLENGISPERAADKFFKFLDSDALLVAHNIHFDFRMLTHLCEMTGKCHNFANIAFCDTIALAKYLVPGLPHYRLSTLVEALKLKGVNSHNALDDTLACGELFFYLASRLPIIEDDYFYEPTFED